ncbi:MAG: hypothetical protein E7466_08180 [Ruminococcaceae bacterium]|nr:hypothetical protein [Oscillospiraceae bacterium]
MAKIQSLALCAVLLLIFTGCLALSDTSVTANETDPPVLTVTQSAEDPLDPRQALLDRYGGEFSLRRSFGMEQIRFKFDENSVERKHFDSMKDDVPTHTGTWDILNGELVITGQWNETFQLDLNRNIAISRAGGEEYRISGKDNSLTMYGELQDTVLTYGFPITLRMLEGMNMTTVVLYETYAQCEWKSNSRIDEYLNLSWSIEGNLLTVSGEWAETFTIDIAAGTATDQSDKSEYILFVIKDGEDTSLAE